MGLLSCVFVSDEVVVVSKAVELDEPGIQWIGRIDCSYAVLTLDTDLAVETTVFLKLLRSASTIPERPLSRRASPDPQVRIG